jgi:hypothetical protein
MGDDPAFFYGSVRQAMTPPGDYAFTGEKAAEASKFLNQLGIPGITYLDAGSRAAGQGTRNYVTFDDALIELLKRNGVDISPK